MSFSLYKTHQYIGHKWQLKTFEEKGERVGSNLVPSRIRQALYFFLYMKRYKGINTCIVNKGTRYF